MYIVRDKRTHEIIHVNPAPMAQQLKGRDVFAQYDAKTMEIGEIDGPLPEHFSIQKDGNIAELSLAEQVEQGFLILEPGEKIDNNRIVQKSISELINEELIILDPTQKLKDNQVVTKSLAEQVQEGLITLNEPFDVLVDDAIVQQSIPDLLKSKMLDTTSNCQEALHRLNRGIERDIARQFTPGYELKVTKAYMDWLREGQPADDPREQTYLEVQGAIDKIKVEYREIKDKVKALLATQEQK